MTSWKGDNWKAKDVQEKVRDELMQEKEQANELEKQLSEVRNHVEARVSQLDVDSVVEKLFPAPLPPDRAERGSHDDVANQVGEKAELLFLCFP